MQIKIYVKRLNLLFLILLFLNCDQGIGGEDIEDRYGGINTEIIDITNTDSYSLYVNTGGSNYNILGKKDNYEARVLLRYSIVDSLSSDFTASLVIYLDSLTSPYSCSLFYVSQNWNEYEVNWQSANSIEKWGMGGGRSVDSTAEYFITTFVLQPESTVIDIPADKKDKMLETFGFLIVPKDSMDFIKLPSKDQENKPLLIIKDGDREDEISPIADAYLVNFDSTDMMKIMDWDYLGAGFSFRTFVEIPFDTIRENYISVRLRGYYSESVGDIDTFLIRAFPVIERWHGKYTAVDEDINDYGYLYPGQDYFDINIKKIVNNIDSNYTGVIVRVNYEFENIFRIKIDSFKLRVFYDSLAEGRF